MTLRQALETAVGHHQAGRLGDAERLYRQILHQDPNEPDTLHFLGLLAHQTGRHDEAAGLFRRAISARPSAADFYVNLGAALAAAGRLDEAVTAYGQALALQPDSVEAYNNLGDALCRKEDWDAAIVACQKALSLRPNLPEAYCNLGRAFQEKGQYDPAIDCYHKALAIRPNYVQAQTNLANAWGAKADWKRAIARGEQAYRLAPNSPEILNNLANAFCADQQIDQAIAYCRQALALAPNQLELYTTLGNVFHEKGDLDQAAACFRHVLARDPNSIRAHWNLSLVLLSQGDYARGWPEYEWRFRIKKQAPRTLVTGPLWDGSDLAGRRILLGAEQGLGDTIQFVRYVPRVIARGGKVIVACHPELLPLLQNFGGIEQAVVRTPPFPSFDVQCSLASMGGIFKTTLEDIPPAPYLSADAALADQWRARMPKDQRLKVGFIWANRPQPPNRCPPSSAWAPLAKVSNVWLCSLQKQTWGDPPPAVEITDWTQELNDFNATAALLANLDLVITVDTAVAHLAGAMGKPVWVLLKYVPDWRWLLQRSDSPWYPSMRLFRQPRIGDWQTPIGQIVEALDNLIANSRTPIL